MGAIGGKNVESKHEDQEMCVDSNEQKAGRKTHKFRTGSTPHCFLASIHFPL